MVVKIDDSLEVKKLDLFFLTSRRIDLFKETVDSLFKVNPNINSYLNKIFILDDRSEWKDREIMVDFLSSYIPGIPTMVCFNDHKPFYWVDRFNMIGRISESKFVFLLEDDWKCIDPVDLNNLMKKMDSGNITQIALCDPLWIQEDHLIEKYKDDDFWDNPWPDDFKHITHRNGNSWGWSLVKMRHYTNNPAITLTSVFKENQFIMDRSFEHVFADNQNSPHQLFSKKLHFEHLGFQNSLTRQ